MDGNRHIKSMRLRNFLSYGSRGEETTLTPLNVLIGKNASGKSNLIEALSLLRSAPKDFAGTLRQGGGIREWLWKGKQKSSQAEIVTVVEYPEGALSLRHLISFAMVGQKVEITDEVIETESSRPEEGGLLTALAGQPFESFFYSHQNGSRRVRGRVLPEHQRGTTVGRAWQQMSNRDFSGDQSILSQLRDPSSYPEITYLSSALDQIRLFRIATFGPLAPARVPQDTSLPEDFLLEDASNLALVLNDFQHRINPKQQVLARLKEFYDEVEDYSTKIRGGTVQLFLHEKGLAQPVPAMRLSDGTLHYLSLLAILCHPTPPPLMCIEEPELGLHPDILPVIAELLKEASERTQLIVTTHSDTLVSALSDTPESILVCERDSEGTHLRRLEREPLNEWLEKYSLGELWRMGEIGGS
jgi:predicted ATPase